MSDAMAYLDGLIVQMPDFANDINELIDFNKRRLWHQLSEKSESLVNNDNFRNRIDLGVFYSRFLMTFASRLNQLSFVRIAISIAAQSKDLGQRIAFLRTVTELPKVKDYSEAIVVARSSLSELLIATGDLPEAKKFLDAAKKTLDETLGADTTVYAAMHHGFASYYKAKGEADNFYRSALQYVGYANLETMPEAEALRVAFDLGIAALIAEKVYNFGDLMETEIVEKLKGGEAQWLWDVLQAFNRGDLIGWKQLQNQFQTQLNGQRDLVSNRNRLTRKIAILTLMEMVFSKPSDDRIVSFESIAKATEMTVDQVEILVMHALSLGLIKGAIDQVHQRVEVTWVQPRILSFPQIQDMGSRLVKWGESVHAALSAVQGSITSELIA
jgi:26S proteasome regulatory subunit N9